MRGIQILKISFVLGVICLFISVSFSQNAIGPQAGSVEATFVPKYFCTESGCKKTNKVVVLTKPVGGDPLDPKNIIVTNGMADFNEARNDKGRITAKSKTDYLARTANTRQNAIPFPEEVYVKDKDKFKKAEPGIYAVAIDEQGRPDPTRPTYEVDDTAYQATENIPFVRDLSTPGKILGALGDVMDPKKLPAKIFWSNIQREGWIMK